MLSSGVTTAKPFSSHWRIADITWNGRLISLGAPRNRVHAESGLIFSNEMDPEYTVIGSVARRIRSACCK